MTQLLLPLRLVHVRGRLDILVDSPKAKLNLWFENTETTRYMRICVASARNPLTGILDIGGKMANGTEEVEKRNSEAIEMAMKDGPDATCPGCGLSRATNGWIGDICPFCRVCRYCGFENGDVKLPFGVDGKHTNRGHHIFK